MAAEGSIGLRSPLALVVLGAGLVAVACYGLALAPAGQAQAIGAGAQAVGAQNYQKDRAVAQPQDPFDLTDEEIELLLALAARREELEQRERAIEQRTALLTAAEARVERKIAELTDLKQDIERLVARHGAESKDRIASLVKIYASMKPKEAARIFAEMDNEVLLQVVRAMPERNAAAILAEMDPKQAKSITVALAETDALPFWRE